LYPDQEDGPEMGMGREVRGEDILGRCERGISSVALALRDGGGGDGGEDLLGLAARVDCDGSSQAGD